MKEKHGVVLGEDTFFGHTRTPESGRFQILWCTWCGPLTRGPLNLCTRKTGDEHRDGYRWRSGRTGEPVNGRDNGKRVAEGVVLPLDRGPFERGTDVEISTEEVRTRPDSRRSGSSTFTFTSPGRGLDDLVSESPTRGGNTRVSGGPLRSRTTSGSS